MAGIETARQTIFTLRQLRDGLDLSIVELDHQKRKDDIINSAFTVLKFTKATCDAFVSMAGALGKAALPGEAGELADKVATGYSALSPLADSLGKNLAGQDGEWGKAALSSAKEASAFGSKAVELTGKSAAVKVEIIIAAMNNDKEGLIKTAADYTVDLNATVAGMIKGKNAPKGKAVEGLIKVAKSAYTYNEQIGKVFNELLDAKTESLERYLTAKRTIAFQARHLSKTIQDLELWVSNCEYQLDLR